MRLQSYLPLSEAERIIWMKRYAVNLPKHGPKLGLSKEEIAATIADIDYYCWVLHTFNPAIQKYSQDVTAFKSFIATGNSAEAAPVPTVGVFTDMPAPTPAGVLNRLFKQIQRHKLHDEYTDSIGQSLGIIAGGNYSSELAPQFNATLENGPNGNRVRIDYIKHGHSGVVVESRVNEGDWVPLGHFTQKVIHNERSLTVPATPESRDFRRRWWDKDEAHGDWSAIRTVLVGN